MSDSQFNQHARDGHDVRTVTVAGGTIYVAKNAGSIALAYAPDPVQWAAVLTAALGAANTANDPRLDQILAEVRDMKAGMAILKTQGETELLDLDAMNAELARNTDVANSTKVLIAHLADEIESAKGDQTKIDAIVATMRANDDTIAAAVVAGTAVDTPPVGGDTGATGGATGLRGRAGQTV